MLKDDLFIFLNLGIQM